MSQFGFQEGAKELPGVLQGHGRIPFFSFFWGVGSDALLPRDWKHHFPEC